MNAELLIAELVSNLDALYADRANREANVRGIVQRYMHADCENICRTCDYWAVKNTDGVGWCDLFCKPTADTHGTKCTGWLKHLAPPPPEN